MKDSDAIVQLKQLKARALAIYSKFHVGALLETVEGEIIEGFNIESSSYGLTICAERVALFKALTEGKRKFRRIYIMGDSKAPCPPCGACRQVLMDYAPELEVVMFSEKGDKQQATLKELLPHAFSGDSLPPR